MWASNCMAALPTAVCWPTSSALQLYALAFAPNRIVATLARVMPLLADDATCSHHQQARGCAARARQLAPQPHLLTCV